MSKIFDAVKQQASVYDVITEFWEKPNHDNMVICPFHNDKNPSLSIDLNTNRWKCFGCPKKGDAIDFVRELKQVGTMEAVRLIADALNIRVGEPGTCKKKRQ